MPWWGWLSIGIFLLAAELLGADAAFYLIFIGAAAILTGLLGLAGLTLPVWAQWLLFSFLAVGAMVLFRRKLYDRFRGGGRDYGNTLINEVVEVTQATAPGAQSRVSLRGSVWTAVNVSDKTLDAGTTATVVDADGMTLKIQARQGEARPPST